MSEEHLRLIIADLVGDQVADAHEDAQRLVERLQRLAQKPELRELYGEDWYIGLAWNGVDGRRARGDIVRMLHERDPDMSNRQIAASIGVDERTVRRDLAGAADAAQDEATPAADAAPPSDIAVEPEPDLREHARGVPLPDAAMRAMVDSMLADLYAVSADENVPITEPKVDQARRLMDAYDEWRRGWLPYMESRLREVK